LFIRAWPTPFFPGRPTRLSSLPPSYYRPGPMRQRPWCSPVRIMPRRPRAPRPGRCWLPALSPAAPSPPSHCFSCPHVDADLGTPTPLPCLTPPPLQKTPAVVEPQFSSPACLLPPPNHPVQRPPLLPVRSWLPRAHHHCEIEPERHHRLHLPGEHPQPFHCRSAVRLTASALPWCCRIVPHHRRPLGATTATGTSPPIPDSATFPPIGCSGVLPLPSACQAGSPSPPCAPVGRPGASSPSVSPCRTCHCATQSARTRGDRAPRALPHRSLGPALAVGLGRAREAMGQK
jgi:hypothetical protein